MRYFLLFVAFMFCNISHAQTALDRGRPAPSDGVFYTNNEAARLLVERETAQLKCDAETSAEKKKLNAILDGEKQKANIILQGEKDKCKLLLDTKDKYINDTLDILEKQKDDYSIWWFLGGVVTGSVGSIFIFFAATQLQTAPNLLGGQ